MPPVQAPAPAPVTGVILAGGGSTRFGAPKGLAMVGGVRIVDRVAAALASATARLLCVANDPAATQWLPGIECISDALPDAGGLGGVHAALAHTAGPVLVVAWDMPFVNTELLKELARRGTQAGADAAVVMSSAPQGMEPFCAYYAPTCLGLLAEAIRARRTGGAQFVRSLPRVAWISQDECQKFGDPTRLFFSVNTLADLDRANALAPESQ